jgi:uncharacterized protein (TIGR00369 family)
MNDQHGFEDASPRIQERIRASFARQGLMSYLGASLSRIGSGRVHIVLPHRPEVTQQDGYIHAGATSAIADGAGGWAAPPCLPYSPPMLSVEYKINLIAPAAGDHLEAEGVVIKSGRTLTICQLEVYANRNQQRTMIAVGQQTLICIPDLTAPAADV